MSTQQSSGKAIVDVRAVHLDLKGVPPTFERLMQLPKVFAAARYNAVVVEWEDAFPWTVDERFRSRTAYTPQQVMEFHNLCKQNGLEIIPLVQCLGHLETVLALDDYAHLREVANLSDVLNPLADGARDIIERMIDDVLALTPDCRYFHLGGDEAWTFGSHCDTKKFIEEHGKGKLYLHHVEPLLDKLQAKNIRPILWHDMMTEWDDESLLGIKDKADLCVWGYHESPYETTAHYNVKHIERFHRCGVRMWGGTAYKGADGVSADIPDLTKRRDNALAWAKAASEYDFVGLIATAWSRYSTGRPQCETTDASLEALISVGSILFDGCDRPNDVQETRKTLLSLGEADRFDRIYQAAKRLTERRSHVWECFQQFYEQVTLTDLIPERRAWEITSAIRENIKHQIGVTQDAAEKFREAMVGLVDASWIDDYIALRITSLKDMAAKIESDAQKLPR